MKFQVPQFIEIEDKIFGPLTIKQFIYLAGGGGMCYLFYAVLPIYIALPAIIAFGTIAVMLAFYKHNNRPFINLVESIFSYLLHGRLYVWRKEEKPIKPKVQEQKTPDKSTLKVPIITESKIHDIASRLDINEQTENLPDDGTGTSISLGNKI